MSLSMILGILLWMAIGYIVIFIMELILGNTKFQDIDDDLFYILFWIFWPLVILIVILGGIGFLIYKIQEIKKVRKISRKIFNVLGYLWPLYVARKVNRIRKKRAEEEKDYL